MYEYESTRRVQYGDMQFIQEIRGVDMIDWSRPNRILCGDALRILKRMPDESVNCVITSPPYYGLRSYGIPDTIWPDGWRGQLGLEPTYQSYLAHLMQVFDEVKRVLRKDGCMFVNLGDSYSGNGSTGGIGKETDYTGKRVLPTKSGVPLKSLIGIPERFAITMTDSGWIRRNTLVWHKPNCMPSSAQDRFTVDFECVYFFVKSGKYWFERQFEALNSSPHSPGNKNKVPMTRHFDEPDRVWGNPQGRNRRCVWRIPTAPYAEAHFATFPPALVEPMIKAGCPPDGIILDPFGGSGTVAATAIKLGRQFISIEIGLKYVGMHHSRIRQAVEEREEEQRIENYKKTQGVLFD